MDPILGPSAPTTMGSSGIRRIAVRWSTGTGLATGVAFVLSAFMGCEAVLGEPDESGPDGRTRQGALDELDQTLSPGLRRLTRIEYANSIRAILGVSVDEAKQPKEQVVRGQSQIAAAQKTGLSDLEQYYSLALESAQKAADDILTECSDENCSTWGQEWLELAWRGPVDEESRKPYLGLLSSDEAGNTPRERLITFITAVLSSPRFLYRLEIGIPAVGEKTERRPLSDYEIATRLSFLVWQGPPDRQLLETAASGKLRSPDGRVEVLTRLLADEKKADGILGFATDWFGVFENHIPQKNAGLLSEAPANLPQAARESFRRTVLEVMASPGAGWAHLLNTQEIVADPAVRELLGLDESEDLFLKVTLPAPYRGLLTHPYVIAAHSKESGASPFPLGEFIYTNVLCEEIPPPPPNVTDVDESEELPDQTLRQRLESLTEPATCNNCHSRIGPPGFAFLPFDPLGGYSPTDGLDRPYDTTGTLLLDRGQREVPFEGVADLGDIFASEAQVSACIGRRLFRFAYGRFENSDDEPALARIATVSDDSSGGLVALLRELVSAPTFSTVQVKP